MKFLLISVVAISILLGLSIAFIETRPHWNDTGISVGLILMASFVGGLLSTQKPWLVALSVGIWIPIFNILIAHNYGSLIALIPAFIGAYGGYFFRYLLKSAGSK